LKALKKVIFVPLWLIALLVHWSPPIFKKGLGRLLCFLWFDLFRIRRQTAIANVKLAYPEKTSAQVRALARESLYHMCLTVVDFCSFSFLKPADLEAMFQWEGLEHLEAALAQGKGVFAMSLHLGNGDLGAVGLAQKDFPVHIISKIFKSQWLNDFWFGARKKLGVRFIPPRKSTYEILKALKAKEVVIFVLDQYTGPPNGILTQFFGHDTGTAVGLALFAQRSGAPVLPVYTYRKDVHRHVIRIEPPIAMEEKDTKEETLRAATQSYNDVIESIVRQHPEQWMWIHRRWKKGF